MDREQVTNEIKALRAKAKAPKLKGFVEGLDDVIYRAQEGISQSDIKTLLTCPFKYFNGIKDEPSPSMIEGTLLHILLNEPHKLNEKFFITDVERITKDVKEEAGERLIYKQKDFSILKECANYTRDFLLKEVGIDIEKMDGEVSYFGEYDGVKAKGRADKITTDRRAVIDFKKCADASPKAFAQQAGKLKYCIQDAFYRELMGLEEFWWVAIETKPLKDTLGKHHFMIGIYKSTSQDLDYGKTLIERGLRVLKDKANFNKPMYPSEDILLDLDFGLQSVREIDTPLWHKV